MSRPARRRISTEMGEHHPDAHRFGAGVPVLQVHAEFTPAEGQNWIWSLPGWFSLGYITIQLWLLLDTALRVRAAGVIGACWRSLR